MILFSLLSWWYTAGWAELAKRAEGRVQSTLEVFSVSLLFGSLFQPFRQISVGGSSSRGFDAQLRAFGDRLFSRVFGAVIRSFFILMGLLSAVLMMLVGLLQVICWPLIPVVPLIGVGLSFTGWVF